MHPKLLQHHLLFVLFTLKPGPASITNKLFSLKRFPESLLLKFGTLRTCAEGARVPQEHLKPARVRALRRLRGRTAAEERKHPRHRGVLGPRGRRAGRPFREEQHNNGGGEEGNARYIVSAKQRFFFFFHASDRK